MTIISLQLPAGVTLRIKQKLLLSKTENIQTPTVQYLMAWPGVQSRIDVSPKSCYSVRIVHFLFPTQCTIILHSASAFLRASSSGIPWGSGLKRSRCLSSRCCLIPFRLSYFFSPLGHFATVHWYQVSKQVFSHLPGSDRARRRRPSTRIAAHSCIQVLTSGRWRYWLVCCLM